MADPTAYVRFPQTPNDNDLEAADSTTFDISGDKTFVVRMRWNGAPESTARTIIGKATGTGTFAWKLQRTGTTGRPTFTWVYDNAGSRSTVTYTVSTTALPSSGWFWLAFTFDYTNGSNSVGRFYTSTDSVDDPSLVTWTLVDSASTQVDGNGKTGWRTTDAVRIGGTEFATHGNPANADIAFVSIRNGIGASGVPGGTEFFKFDAATDVTSSGASTVTTSSGHTLTVFRNGSPGIELVPPAPTASSSVAVTGAAEVLATASASVAATGEARVLWNGPRVARDRGMPGVLVHAAVGQTYDTAVEDLVWTRIDTTVCVRRITTREGRDSRIDEVNPGEFDIVFDNRSGALDPTNDQSPYWTSGKPGIDYGTRIRVTLTDPEFVADDEVVFVGMVWRMLPDWDLDDATMTVQLVDSLAVLAGTDLPVSALRQDLVADPVVGNVWPLSTSGTIIDDIKGTLDGSWSDPVAVGEHILPYDDSPSVVLADGIAGTITGLNFTTANLEWWGLQLWVVIDKDTVADGDLLFTIKGPSHSIAVSVAMPGRTLKSLATGGTTTTHTGVVADGELHLITVLRNGTSSYALRVDSGSDQNIGHSPGALTLADVVLGSTSVAVAPARVSYLAFGNLVNGGSDYRMTFALSSGLTPWAGDTTAERFERLCDLAHTGHEVVGTTFPECAPAGEISDEKALDHVSRCAAGDGAVVTVNPANGGVPLYRLTDPDDPVVWFDTRGEVGAPARDVKPSYGIDRLAGRVEVKRGNGEVQAVASTEGYPTAPVLKLDTTLLEAADARARATAVLLERQVPRMLTPTMSLAGRDRRIPWAALFMRPGDLAGQIAHPPGRSEFVQVSSVERVEHTLDFQAKTWEVVYGLDRVAQFLSWQDVIDGWATWTALVAAFPTWADLLAAASPTPTP